MTLEPSPPLDVFWSGRHLVAVHDAAVCSECRRRGELDDSEVLVGVVEPEACGAADPGGLRLRCEFGAGHEGAHRGRFPNTGREVWWEP